MDQPQSRKEKRRFAGGDRKKKDSKENTEGQVSAQPFRRKWGGGKRWGNVFTGEGPEVFPGGRVKKKPTPRRKIERSSPGGKKKR